MMRLLTMLLTLVVLGPAAAYAQPGATPVDIVGVEDEALREALQAALPARAPPDGLFQAERLAEEAAAIARRFLRAEGYYAAEATPQAAADPPLAQIAVMLGPRFSFTAPQITYSGEAPSPEAALRARAGLGALRQGAPARAADVLAAEAAALDALRAAGHADAAALPRAVVVDHATGQMQVTLQLAAGPMVRLGRPVLRTGEALRPETLDRFATWEEGEAYTPEALRDTRRALAAAGAFAQVEAALSETPNTDGSRDVLITVIPVERRTIEGGVSWSTAEGAGAEAIWTRRNTWRRAETLRLGAVVAETRQAVTAELSLPRAGPQGQTLRFAADLAHEDLGPFTRDGTALSIAVEGEPRRRLTPGYGASIAADVFSEAAGVENAVVLAGFGELRFDQTDDPLDARSGTAVRARLEPTLAFGDAFTGFARATLEARGFHTPAAAQRLTLAARARFGWVAPFAGEADDIPLDRLFYAGGGGSVRGYAFNTIFPEDRPRTDLAPGGQGLVEASVEARWRATTRWGGAVFLDAGQAFDSLDEAAELQFGAGFGLRYDLGFAPLRLDIAFPLNRRDGDEPVAAYVSIGQAF